jgi:hypothetical protein
MHHHRPPRTLLASPGAGTVARVIGQVADGWLVGTINVGRTRNRRVVRVEADGSVVDVLRDIDVPSVILSADGTTLAGPTR